VGVKKGNLVGCLLRKLSVIFGARKSLILLGWGVWNSQIV